MILLRSIDPERPGAVYWSIWLAYSLLFVIGWYFWPDDAWGLYPALDGQWDA